MTNTPRCEVIKLTKPTNTLQLSQKVSEGRISVYLVHEDREVIKPLKVKSSFGNEIVLSETINHQSIKHRYYQEVDEWNNPFGEKFQESIYIQVFYECERVE